VALTALAASAAGGFLLGSAGSGDEAPKVTRAQPKVPAAELAQAEYVRDVSPAIDRLSERRAAARRSLRRARLPENQAVAARRLVKAYAQARRRVSAEPPASADAAGLRAELRSVERAYRRMATAARNDNRRAWRSASRAAATRERSLDRSLRSLSSA
jgi:hypothetical protein